jgi:hypothetical protein
MGTRNRKKTNWIKVKRIKVVFLKLLWSPGIDSKELIPPAYALAGLYNNPVLLWSPGIDSKELIPPAYALAGLYNNPIPAWFLAPLNCSKVPAPSWYF